MSTVLAMPLSPRVLLLWLAALTSAHAAELFRDVSKASGISFQHENGARGKRHLYETMIGGAAWLDFDRDGFLDLYIVQAHSNSDHAAQPGIERDVLYRNRGDGTFEDATERARVGDPRYGSGAAVGDIDNDGWPDIYVTNYGRNTLYRNRGDGTFEDITDAAGVACAVWSASAAFADFDGDGLLDLYVANYTNFDPRVHGPCTANGVPGYCHPNKFEGVSDTLYRNLGGLRFEDVTRGAGIYVAGKFKGNGLGVLPTDYDGDGDVDVIVAADSVPNRLWRNLGNLRFEDAAIEAGIALSVDGKAYAGMGIDGGDVNGDGFIDYVITNFAREPDSLYLGGPGGFLDERAGAAGLAAPTFLPLSFGCKLFDFDLDGDLDYYTACGHTSDSIEQSDPGSGETHAQPSLLFENDGKGKFRDVASQSGEWFRRRLVGRGAAFADYDNDGDVDIFVVNKGGPGVLLRNERANQNHWLGLLLEGDGKRVNRAAFGAKVTVVTSAGIKRSFEVRTAASYLSAHDHRLSVGLGAERQAARVEVTWPDQSREVFVGLKSDAYNPVRYGAGASERAK